MQFPYLAETFAGVEVLALRELGVDVDVYGLRPEHPHHATMVRERRLQQVSIKHQTAARTLRGLLDAMLAPRRSFFLLTLVLRHVRHVRERLKSLALLPIVMRIDAELREGDYDVVHLFWGHYPALVGAVLQRFHPHLPVSLFLGAYDLRTMYGPSAVVGQASAHVWTHAAVNLSAIEGLGIPRERVHVVYRGVDLATIDSVRGRSTGRVPGRVVTAGRLIATKGALRVLRAFAVLRERQPEVTLTVLGDGPERSALEATAYELGVASSVRFAGHVAHDEVIETLAGAEAFVLLSHDERLPNAVKEAMACGVVCVVSRTPGIDELVEHEWSGFIVDGDDAVAVADSVAMVLAGGDRIAEVKVRARRHVEQRFAASASAATLASAWAASAAEAKR